MEDPPASPRSPVSLGKDIEAIEEPGPPEKMSPAASWIRLLVVLLFCGGLTFGVLYGAALKTLPDTSALTPSSILWLTVAVAYGIQWVAFVPANIYETEKYYDFTGSLTYFTCTVGSLCLGWKSNPTWSLNHAGVRSLVQSIMVILWCTRLGYFLYSRISADKKDGRFDEIKINPPRFLGAWTIQGTWVTLTALPVFTVNAFASNADLGALDIVGWVVWALGFGIEIISDNQKSAFAERQKQLKANNKDFQPAYINEGLWYYSRHPNYFGEITLWLGQFIAASSTFSGTQWVCVLSPLFVIFLLMKVSGVPMLEQRSDEKFGGDPHYEVYKQNTSVLVPWCKGSATVEDLDASMLDGNATSA